MGAIYLATNTINGKAYVGKSQKTMEYRQKCHHQEARSGSDFLFHRALRKYGVKAFTWEVLATSDRLFILNDLEMSWIVLLRTKVPNGYNLTDGGEGMTGFRHSPETRRLLSAKSKAQPHRKWSKEIREKFRVAAKRQWADPEKRSRMMKALHKPATLSKHRADQLANWADPKYQKKYKATRSTVAFREKIRQALTNPSPETRQRMSDAGKRRSPASEETRRKLSAALRGREVSIETRQKISAAHLGRKVSPETCLKIGITSKARCPFGPFVGRKHTTESRQKMKNSHLGHHPTLETRKKMGEAQQRRYLCLQ
jgi:group I intron endonuclease